MNAEEYRNAFQKDQCRVEGKIPVVGQMSSASFRRTNVGLKGIVFDTSC